MLERVKKFIKSEEGYTTEGLIWNTVLGLGAATLAFGIFAADRFQGGNIGSDMKAVVTPSSLPTGGEQVTQLKAGYTGAVTGITVGAGSTGTTTP